MSLSKKIKDKQDDIIIKELSSCRELLIKTNNELNIYNRVVSIHQKVKSMSGKLLEKSISDLLSSHHIAFKEQVAINSNGIIIETKANSMCVIDFVLGHNISPGKNIKDFIVISSKTSCRERWNQDNWTLTYSPTKYFLVTLYDDYPQPEKFGESNTRKLVTEKAKKTDKRKFKLNFDDLVKDININSNNTSMIKFIDLFCGIGSFHYSLKKLGMKCIMACDVVKIVRDTYEANYNIKPLEDIIDIEPQDVPAYDVLCGGFPCQPWSNIGKHKGFEDSRGEIFYQIMKFVVYHKPKCIILENVQALKTHDNGQTLNKIINEFSKQDYTVFNKIIKCSDYGIPQMRKRLFIVAIQNNIVNKLNLTANDVFNFPKRYTMPLGQFLGIENIDKKEAYTIRCGGRHSPINDKHNWDGYMVNGTEYRLTINDCLKLQGYNPDFILLGSDTQKFKMLGNTIPTNFTFLIGQMIKDILLRYSDSN